MELTREHSGRVPGLLYPMLVIAAIAVIVFSVLGIASVSGWMPRVMMSADRAVVALESGSSLAPGSAQPVADVAQASAAFQCAECGVIDSVREIEHSAATTPRLPYSTGI